MGRGSVVAFTTRGASGVDVLARLHDNIAGASGSSRVYRQ